MSSILVLDRHADTAEMYAVGLEMASFQATVVEDSAAALDYVRGAHPDAFVVDVRTASENGWKLIRDLKEDPLARNMPVILLAGRIGEFTPASAKALGCGPLILKPCLPDTLAAVLRQILHSAASDRTGVFVSADNFTGAGWRAPAYQDSGA